MKKEDEILKEVKNIKVLLQRLLKEKATLKKPETVTLNIDLTGGSESVYDEEDR